MSANANNKKCPAMAATTPDAAKTTRSFDMSSINDSQLMTIEQARALELQRRHQAGEEANRQAAANAFTAYKRGKADNTKRRWKNDLDTWAEYLRAAGLQPGDLYNDPEAWRATTWGEVEAFQLWLLGRGYALNTINFKLSTIKVFCRLAVKAGTIDPKEFMMIRMVSGFTRKEYINIDKERKASGHATRYSAKKADYTEITKDQARALKRQPNTPQGRRDAVLMHILLDQGLRCGEVARLQVENIHLEEGTFTFDRPKVQIRQTHNLTKGTLKAIRAYLELDHPSLTGPLMLGSRKGGRMGSGGGALTNDGMTERAITARVQTLGALIGIENLSAHDCRHYWATELARNGTRIDVIKDAGGWKSYAMPNLYIAAQKIANEGINLGAD